MRQYNLAIRDYDEAIRLNSYYAPAFNGRGNAYAALRQYDLAIRDYSDSIWLNPTEAIPFNNRGLAYEKLGTSIDVNSPVNAFQQVIDQNVRNNASAMKDFDEAVRLDPNFASAIYNRAVLFRYLGQQGRASAEFAKARQLNPNLPPPQDNGVQVR